MEPIESPFIEEFDTIKLILLVELEPGSDHFHQIAFTEEQILKIQKFVSQEVLGEEADGSFKIIDNPGVCFKGRPVKGHFTEEEIEALST